jgi:hypothetical protein
MGDLLKSLAGHRQTCIYEEAARQNRSLRLICAVPTLYDLKLAAAPVWLIN